MGLDIVEFLMNVEEALGVRLPDKVAETTKTPRMLVNFFHGQFSRSAGIRCLSQRAFYSVRHALSERMGLPKASLRPTTKLLTVLPGPNAQEVWAEVGKSLGYIHWPRVRGGGWLARFFLCDRPQTLGEAARQVAIFSPCALKPSAEGWSWHEVESVVRGQMCHHFAVRNFSLDDRFVEDLGLS